MHRLSAALILVLVALALTASAQSGSPLRLMRKIALPEVQGRIDHMAVDVKTQRVFVAARDNNSVEIVDLKLGKLIHRIDGLAEPQGVAYVPQGNRVLVTHGSDGTVRLFNGTWYSLISSIKLGDDADNVYYSPGLQVAFVGYGQGGISMIDPAKGKVIGSVKLSAHPEAFAVEKSGSRIYVNVPGAKEISVIDRIKQAVVAQWPMTVFTSNFPMALDEAHGRLFVGTRKPAMMVVLDTRSGLTIANFRCSKDADDLSFDSVSGRIYVSCGEGFIEVFEQRSADTYFHVATMATAPGARTSLLVPELKLFLVAVPRYEGHEASVWVYETLPPRAFAQVRERKTR